MKKITLLLLCFYFSFAGLRAENIQVLLQKGWDQLVKDNDTAAIKLFNEAYELAKMEHNTALMADALLKLGIASYGSSLSNGLSYATASLEEIKKLEALQPQVAALGRAKCLQLISTIKGRQGKFRESIELSRSALIVLATSNDSSGYPGLIYSSLGTAYDRLHIADSSEYYHRLALKARQLNNDSTYLPASYVSVAAIEMQRGNKALSNEHYTNALEIATRTGNRQAQVEVLIGLGKWSLAFEHDRQKAKLIFQRARTIAKGLSDKSFLLNALEQLKNLEKQEGNFKEALAYEEMIRQAKDTFATWEKERVTRSLEVQFGVAEKDRQLSLVQKEKDITLLTNYLLWVTVAFLIAISGGVILFLRRINKRDKLLIHAKDELVKATEEQRRLKEQQMRNEIEFKESQLNALTLQMLQKNELMQELNNKLKETKDPAVGDSIGKIINKGLIQDKEWNDFNTSFESINKNFYARLRAAYPGISPNDLKMCALIKMNLSIKEMAAILNISPDSVKTARYRLRKKLQLNTEDNLTDFILNLE